MKKQHRPRISNSKPEIKYGIPFSRIEMAMTILALREFRKFYSHPDVYPQMTARGLAVLDKLIGSLEVAYTFFKRAE